MNMIDAEPADKNRAPKPQTSADSLTGSLLEYDSEPSLVLILKWGGELTPAGKIQAEELGKAFRCMYPGGQGMCCIL